VVYLKKGRKPLFYSLSSFYSLFFSVYILEIISKIFYSFSEYKNKDNKTTQPYFYLIFNELLEYIFFN